MVVLPVRATSGSEVRSLAKLKIFDKKLNRSKEAAIIGPVFQIGKLPENDLVLDRFNVSRRHCRIVQRNGTYVLEDSNSTNGTFTDSGRVTGPTPLREGAQILIGDFVLVFSSESVKPAPASAPAAVSAAAGAAAKPAAEVFAALKPAPNRPAATREEAAGEERHTPVELKKKVHEMLLEEMDLRHVDITDQTHEELREKAETAVASIVSRLGREVPAWLKQDELVTEVVNEAVGLGPLEGFLADRTVDEIMVNNWDLIYIERNGRIERTNKRFTDNRQVLAVIRRILAPIGRRVDESSPMVDARLPDGSRVNAIIAPLSLTGPTLTIRKFAYEPFETEDMIGFGTMNLQIADFLKLAVAQRMNIMISGGTGSGKTTLLNVVSMFISPDERIVTIEDSAELKLPQEHVISLESKPPNIEGRGEIPIRKLVINSLRMRPNRIIVGECRGGEALDMLQAMNTGHDGSLTTLHANSARDALARLETLVLMSGMELPPKAIRDQVASAINLIVHTARLPDGKRKVMTVTEVTGMEGDVITLQDIYVFRQTGIGADGMIVGHHEATGAVPKFVHSLKQRGIEVDMRLFAQKNR